MSRRANNGLGIAQAKGKRQRCSYQLHLPLLLATLSYLMLSADYPGAKCNGVVINEILYHPPAIIGHGRNQTIVGEQGEWIELHNTFSRAIDISGFSLSQAVCFSFPNVCIPSNGFFVIARNPGLFSDIYPDFSGLVFGPYNGRLNNSGDILVLKDQEGETVDSIEYRDRPPWPALPDGYGFSLERVSFGCEPTFQSSWEASEIEGGTPGFENSCFRELSAVAAPLEIEVHIVESPGAHGYSPKSPVTIEVTICDEANLASATLEYQVVNPGAYISLSDSDYKLNWIAVEMERSDCGRYRASVGPFPRRSLLRWRIQLRDVQGNDFWYPRKDDPVPNKAAFFYDSIPDYIVGLCGHGESTPIVYTNARGELETVPVYFLLAKTNDVALAFEEHPRYASNKTYPWHGTFVFEGKAYDHVKFRLRGGSTRFEKKRSLKIELNRSDLLQSHSHGDFLLSYSRRHINLNRAAEHFGLHEALAYRVFREAGVSAPETAFVHLRIIQSDQENDSRGGDFFGLYLDVEEIGQRFMKVRHIKASSLYEMLGTPIMRGQTADPKDRLGDLFISEGPTTDANWLRQNVNFERYFAFRAAAELTDAFDLLNRNYFLLKRQDTRKWELVPCDLNGTFGVKRIQDGDVFVRGMLNTFAEEYTAVRSNLIERIAATDFMRSSVKSLLENTKSLMAADSARWQLGSEVLRVKDPAQAGEYFIQWSRRWNKTVVSKSK